MPAISALVFSLVLQLNAVCDHSAGIISVRLLVKDFRHNSSSNCEVFGGGGQQS